MTFYSFFWDFETRLFKEFQSISHRWFSYGGVFPVHNSVESEFYGTVMPMVSFFNLGPNKCKYWAHLSQALQRPIPNTSQFSKGVDVVWCGYHVRLI